MKRLIQWGVTSAGWLAPYMADHETLLKRTAARHPDFDWDDFLPTVRDMASYKGKLLGIPYRVTANILHYQKPLLDAAGIPSAPGNWDEFLATCLAINKPPQRYALGIWGRQGPAIVGDLPHSCTASAANISTRRPGRFLSTTTKPLRPCNITAI